MRLTVGDALPVVKETKYRNKVRSYHNREPIESTLKPSKPSSLPATTKDFAGEMTDTIRAGLVLDGFLHLCIVWRCTITSCLFTDALWLAWIIPRTAIFRFFFFVFTYACL